MAGGIALQSSSGGTVTFTVPETSTSSTISLDFSSLKSQNGYQKLPGGLIIQWGKATTRNTYTAFPMAFPTALYTVVVTSTTGLDYIASSTLSGFTPQDAQVVSNGRFWIAIGN